jgi:DDE superfamily endonuclease
MALVATLIEEDNDAILIELCSRLEERTGVKVSRATMGRISQKLNLTRKKKTIHASERYTERVQKLRVEYWTTISPVKLADLVFIDEAGVNIVMTRLFARSPQGSRAYGNRPDGRGKNVTMIGAMSTEGIIAAMTFTGGTTPFPVKEYRNIFLSHAETQRHRERKDR